MRAKVTVYNINSEGKIWDQPQGLEEGYQYEIFLAKYSIAHIDAVLVKPTPTSTTSTKCDHNSTVELLNTIWGKNLSQKPH